jgi:hypothetical protein
MRSIDHADNPKHQPNDAYEDGNVPEAHHMQTSSHDHYLMIVFHRPSERQTDVMIRVATTPAPGLGNWRRI